MITTQAISSTNYVKALTVGELIKNIFAIYRKYFVTILIVSGIAAAISLISVLQSMALFFSGVMVIVCSRAILEKPIKLIDLYANIFRSNYLWPIFVFSLFMIPLLIPVLLFDAEYAKRPTTVNLLGQQFFIALLSFLTIFFAGIVLIEKRRTTDSLKRFSSLLFSNFLPILGKFFVSYLVYFVILLFFATVFANLLATYPNIALWITLTICHPIIYLAGVLLYYDTRVRKENYSEELLAEELGYHADIEMIST